MLTNSSYFPSPTPDMGVFGSNNLALTNAIAIWGPVGARGSHADHIALLAANAIVYNDLVTLAAYVQSLTDLSQPYTTQATFITLSGFGVKNLPTPQGLLGVPQNFHQVFSNNVDSHTPWLDWKKPTGLTSPNNVASYEVFRSLLNTQPILSIATTTETKFIDTDPTLVGQIWYYWIQAINDAGRGAPTASLLVSVPL